LQSILSSICEWPTDKPQHSPLKAARTAYFAVGLKLTAIGNLYLTESSLYGRGHLAKYISAGAMVFKLF